MAPRNRLSLEHLFGNTNIARNIFPTITGRIRKSNPDGSSTVAYVPTLSGKILNIEYTKEIASVVTVFTTSVTFAANGFQAAIDQINLLDTAHVEASDLDGFLSIRNKNPGKTHYIQINGSSDAAPLLGFNQNPTTGFKSVAGEIASSPVDRLQKNPTGTAGISRDETLEGSAFNRALAGFADVLARLSREQDREVAGYAQVELSASNLFTLTSKVAIKFTSPIVGMRIPLNAFPEALVPSQPGLGRLGAFFRLQTVDGEEPFTAGNDLIRITKVLWGNPATVSAVNDTQAFATYTPLPSPTAFSIFGTGAGGAPSKLVKVASQAISEIQGNVVKVGGSPNYLSGGLVYPGDTAKISSSGITSPFTHNGEFIVEEVLDNNTLVLRPKTRFDPLADATADIPPGLNQGTSGMGNLEILVGTFLNGAGLIFLTDCPASFISDMDGVVFRYATGVRFKEMNSDKFARPPLGGMRELVAKLISTVDPDGAAFVGARENDDLSLSEGTVRDQLDELSAFWAKLDRANTFVETQEVDGAPGDTSAALSTVATPAARKLLWKMSTGVAATQITRLYFYAESTLIGFELTINAEWDSGTARFIADDTSKNSMMLHFDDLQLQLLMREAGGPSPFTYVEFDKVIINSTFTTLSTSTPMQFLAGGVDIGSENLASDQHRISVKRATVEETLSSVAPVRTLMLEDIADIAPDFLPDPKAQLRLYLSPADISSGGGIGEYRADSLEITSNAKWNGSQWVMDASGIPACLYAFDPFVGFQMKIRNISGPGWTGLAHGTFDDVLQPVEEDQSDSGNPTGWTTVQGFAAPTEQTRDTLGPSGATKRLTSQKQVAKVWGHIDLFGSPTIRDGWSVASAVYIGNVLRVSFAFNLRFDFPSSEAYIAMAQYIDGSVSKGHVVSVVNQTIGFVDFSFKPSNSGAYVDPATLDGRVGFVLFGEYTTV